MEIKKIDENTYQDYVSKSNMQSFYQSIEWYNLKISEGKEAELLGLYEDNTLLGVSLVTYLKVLKFFKFAYMSRGFIYDYTNISDFTTTLCNYFKNKSVIFFRMDPLIELCRYDKDLVQFENNDGKVILDKFINNGYILNEDDALQFKYIYKIDVLDTFLDMSLSFNKSTKKNIEYANDSGVRVKTTSDLDLVYKYLSLSVDNKHIKGYSKEYYQNLIDKFKNKIIMYITYIDKDIYISSLEKKLNESKEKLSELEEKSKNINVGKKIKKAKELLNNSISKYENELEDAKSLDDITNIASMFIIDCFDEVVAFASGMDNRYRKFCPKYVMYPELFKYAVNNKKKYINLLGVQNIFDKSDPDYGVYEVKRGFGGYTEELVGELDYPINKLLYKVYRLKRHK